MPDPMSKPSRNWPIAFASGFIAVLVFHQGMLDILGAVGLTARTPFPNAATWPLGLPQIWSAAFWGGLWGLVLVAVHRRFPKGAAYWGTVLLFGALGPTLVNWFVVAPLHGAPLAAGGDPAAMLTGLLVNAAWGVGAAGLYAAAVSSGGRLAPEG